MNQYRIGALIKRLREQKKLTQSELAEKLHISDKTISKWETGKGFPDITLLEPLAQLLGISLIELLSGADIHNQNRSANLLKSHFYVCPLCGNILYSTGAALISCCGLTLYPCEVEEPDEAHHIQIETVEDEWFVSVEHPMTKEHSISFLAFVTSDRCQLVKLYPEGNAETRFFQRGSGWLYAYCNQHGLFRQRIMPQRTERSVQNGNAKKRP